MMLFCDLQLPPAPATIRTNVPDVRLLSTTSDAPRLPVSRRKLPPAVTVAFCHTAFPSVPVSEA